MIVTPPSDDELRALLVEHAHRHPTKASITVIGDGGQPVRLPMIVGNPAGACAMPDAKPSSAWNEMLGAALGLIVEPANLGARLAQDVVLWPDRATVGKWLERWPALPKKIADLLGQKLAVSDRCIEEPAFDEDPPAAIAKAIADNPRAVWRRLRPSPDTLLHVAVSPPAPAAYRIFKDALKKAKAAPWPIVRDAAIGGIIASVDDSGVPVNVAADLARWPGLAALVIAEMQGLAGSDAEVHLGEW
jgi:hypothetical protein